MAILRQELEHLKSYVRLQADGMREEQTIEVRQIQNFVEQSTILNSTVRDDAIQEKSQKYIRNLQMNLEKCQTKIETLENQIETYQQQEFDYNGKLSLFERTELRNKQTIKF